MPQAANIVINDGSGTPVSYTFSPTGKDDKGVFWFVQTVPTPVAGSEYRIGYKQTQILDLQKQLTGKTRITYTLQVPTPETVANNSAGIVPPPTIAYVNALRLDFEVADRGTVQERKNTRVFLANFLATAMAIANIDTKQPSYS